MPNPAHSTPRRYHLLVLGLWLQPGEPAGRAGVWRISLEDPRTAQRRGFTSVEELAAYLDVWMKERTGGER